MTVEGKSGTRAAMPLCTEIIDDVRAAFGDPVRIVAQEGGREVVWGRPPLVGRWVVAQPNVFPGRGGA